MDRHIEDRLKAVEDQLKQFSQAVDALGRDLKRPVSAVRDGYYEAALTNAGSIIEAMLRDIWVKEKISGKADAKTIEQLFSLVKEQAGMDRLAQDYVRDIQLVRNRAAHGEQIVIEDCIECLRKLAVVLDWYFKKYIGGQAEPAPEPPLPVVPPPARNRWRHMGLVAAYSVPILALLAAAIASYLRHHPATGNKAPAVQQLKSFDYSEFKRAYWKMKLGADPALISISMEGADKGPTVLEVITQIGREGGFNIFISPISENLNSKISSRIFGSLCDLPWTQALEMVLDTFGLAYFCESNVILVGDKRDIDRFSGLDILLIPTKDRAAEFPVEPPFGSLISPAGKWTRVDQGKGSLWIVEDLPMRIDFITDCLKARGIVREFKEVVIDSMSCQQGEALESDSGPVPYLVRFRNTGLANAKAVNVDFQNEDIRKIIKSFADGAGLSYTVSAEVPRMNVTVKLKDVQPGMAFCVICFLCGLHHSCSNGMISVYTAKEIPQHRLEKTYLTTAPAAGELTARLPEFLLPWSSLHFEPQGGALSLSGSQSDQQKLELILRHLEAITQN